MPDVQPLRALHYNLPSVGELDRVTAPPYDVIGANLRRELANRSPYNVVHVDLPRGPDPYGTAESILSTWKSKGVLERDPEPALWPLVQEYAGPDGRRRSRHGFFARVRLERYEHGRIRPHEQTHAAPKEDRLQLTRATRTNLSPIFGLYEDVQGSVWRALEPLTESEDPWAEVTDDEGTVHRLWRAGAPEIAKEVAASLRDTEILIADGHHRYETAVAYADEIGADGDHRYVLMCLVATSDPGLTVFPIHRLLSGLNAERLEHLRADIDRNFKTQPVSVDAIINSKPNISPGVFGYLDSSCDGPLRIAVTSFAILDELLKGHSAAYCRLDTAILETLVFRRLLDLSDEDITQKRGLGYTKDAGKAVSLVRSGKCQAAFLLRPTPIDQVQAIAAAGETMPPKSTYFYPKLLSGMLFNPLT